MEVQSTHVPRENSDVRVSCRGRVKVDIIITSRHSDSQNVWQTYDGL